MVFPLEFFRKTEHLSFYLQSQFEERIEAVKDGCWLSELPKVQIVELSFPAYSTVSLSSSFEGKKMQGEPPVLSSLAHVVGCCGLGWDGWDGMN